MADKRRYNAHLNRKGLDEHLTVEQAGTMAHRQGSSYLFIVSAHAGPKTVEEDGTEDVALIVDTMELVPEEQEELVRRYQRALYMKRPAQEGQAVLTGATEEDPEAVAAELDSAVETGEDGEPSGVWDGDPAAPLTAVPDAPDEGDTGATCPFPDCIRDEEHDGPHRDRAGHILGSDVDDDTQEG